MLAADRNASRPAGGASLSLEAADESPLLVPVELLDTYQPMLGPDATLAWINLLWLARTGFAGDPEAELARRLGIDGHRCRAALHDLVRAGLLEPRAGGFLVRRPSPRRDKPSLPARAPQGSPRAPSGGVKGRWDSPEAALRAVVDFYHKRIGMLGPTQFEKLRFWVEDQGMAADVVALAIEETVTQARSPRIQYLEGILRNWYNDGIRTVEDLRRSGTALRAAEGPVAPGGRGGAMEGVPNASAYERVDPDLVRRWKELYPDEYDRA